MADKKEPDAIMELSIEDRKIDIFVYIGDDYRGLRYELTSENPIDPLDAGFSLLLIVKSIAKEQGLTLEELMKNYASVPLSAGGGVCGPGDGETTH